MSERLPSLDIELFSDEAIANPYPRYEAIRNADPVVWLERYDVWRPDNRQREGMPHHGTDTNDT